MDFGFNDEYKMIQKMYCDFAEKEIKPLAEEIDENERFPKESVQKMAENGMFGIPFPEEYGGEEGDYLSYVIAVEELSKVCASTGVTLSAHTSLGSAPIYDWGTEEQKQKYLVPAASGETLCAFALTEPQSGSDSGGTKTSAVLDEKTNEWVINGTKAFITNIGYAKTFLVACKTDLEAKGSRGISIIIVEEGTPGFTIGKPEEKMSNHSSYSGELSFQDCRVPKENLVGELNRGFPLMMSCVDEGRLAISAVAIGMAQGVLERATRYSKQRVAFGNPICTYQGISFKLAEMAADIEACRMMLYNVCRMKEAGLPFATEATMVKMLSSEMCVNVCDKGVQILGGYGLCEEYEVERFYRDAKLLTIGEGTSEICRMIVSGSVLKQYE